MADLVAQKLVKAGLEPVYTGVDQAGDTVDNNQNKSFVHIINGSAAEITVTIKAQRDCNQGERHDTEIVLATTEEAFVPLLPYYNNENQRAEIEYSEAIDEETVQIAAFTL